MKVIRRQKTEGEVRRLEVAEDDVQPKAITRRGWNANTIRSEVEGTFREHGARVWREEVSR